MPQSNLVDLRQLGDSMPVRIFNANKTDYQRPELFLGQPGGLLDTINSHYPDLLQLHDELKATDWKRNEFDYGLCQIDFKTCSPSVYRMMIRTLAWQWEGDSAAARGISDIIVPLCTSMETRVGYTKIAENENLHAMTYSEIVRGSFEDPNEILAEITSIRESHGRMAVVGGLFERARKASLEWQMTGIRTKAIEQAVMLFVCAMYALERIQFMISFAVTFAVCEMKLFEPIGAAVQMIARDEYGNHVPFGEAVFKHLMATAWGREAFAAVRDIIIQMLVELLRTELSWTDYLHSDGDELPGVPPEKLKAWALFNGRAVCVAFGVLDEVESILGVEMPTQLPLHYMKAWIAIDENQSSPQEQDNNQYLLNTVSTVNIPTAVIEAGDDFKFD